MAILPELETILNKELSLQEAKGILRKYQSLPRGDYYNDSKYILDDDMIQTYFGENHKRKNTSKTGWDSWDDVEALKPLRLPQFQRGPPYWPLWDTGESKFYLCNSFQKRFLRWLCDPGRETNLFWIDDPNLDRVPVQWSGSQRPFGVAFSLATLLWETCRLASPNTIILRRGNLIPEIASELAAQYPPYRRLLTAIFIEDPSVFEKEVRHQFRTLILQPWKEIIHSHPLYSLTPPLIILNGRDEDQVGDSFDFIEVIREHATLMANCPLLWVVCTRSAKLRRSTFLDFPIQWEYALLSLRDVQPWRQVDSWLRTNLDHIRAQFLWLPDALEGESWPPEEQMSRLVEVAAGVFDFADAALCFIAYGAEGSPVEKLNRLLDLMIGSPRPTDAEPFLALHYLFSQFLSSISPGPRQHTMMVLEVLFASRGYSLPFSNPAITTTTRHLAHYSGLSLQDFRSVQSGIMWTLRGIQTSSGVLFSMNISFRHFLESTDTKFTDLLLTTGARGYYSQIAKSSMNLSYSITNHFGDTRWRSSYSSPLGEAREFNAMFQYATRLHIVAMALRAIPKDTRDSPLLSFLRDFDFRRFVDIACWFSVFDFASFLIALRASRNHLSDLVRTEAVTDSDNQLLNKCKGIALPMVLCRAGYCIRVLEHPRYVLLGYNEKTVLAVFSANRETKPFGTDTGVAVYSLDMLDEI